MAYNIVCIKSFQKKMNQMRLQFMSCVVSSLMRYIIDFLLIKTFWHIKCLKIKCRLSNYIQIYTAYFMHIIISVYILAIL